MKSFNDNINDDLLCIEAPFHDHNNSAMFKNHQYVINKPIMKDLHAQDQDSTHKSYFHLLQVLREIHNHFREEQIKTPMILHGLYREAMKLHHQLDESQPDPLIVSNMDTFLHDFANSSSDSEDGEKIHPPEKFHRKLIHSPTRFDCMSNFCSGYDEFLLNGEFHSYQCSSSSTSDLKSNEATKDLVLSHKPDADKIHLTSVSDIKDYRESYTCANHVDNLSYPFDSMKNSDEPSITYISSSEDLIIHQPRLETSPSSEFQFHVYGETPIHEVIQDHEDVVTLEYQSFHGIDSPYFTTSLREFYCTESETHGEISINYLCDSST